MSKITINMLGKFCISYKGRHLSETDNRGSKTRLLLQYLIAHRDREISQNELIELIWPDSTNPASALKTLVHRTREALSQILPENAEMIENNHGSYRFNTELDCYIDSGEFVRLIEMGDDESISRTRRVHLYTQAFELYKGGYLVSSCNDTWVMPLYVYFQTMYISAVDKCAKLLYPMGKYSDIVAICEKAMMNSPTDEMIHAHLIRAMVALGEYEMAGMQYEYAKRILYDQYGVSPSSRLTDLYELTVKPHNEIQHSADVVIGDLIETVELEGGFFCEYEVFRYIFRVYMRESKRKATKISLFLVTLEDKQGGELTEGKLLQKAMQKLSDCIRASLRMRDVYTRFSRCQYILLLPDADQSSEVSVKSRILGKFQRHEQRFGIHADFVYRELSGN